MQESWDYRQYEIKDFLNRRQLPTNNKSILQELGLPFTTYHSNQEVPCFTYDIAH